MAKDPANTPAVHQVLYTNDVIRLMSGFVMGLLSVAHPDRVKAALEAMLTNWDERVKTAKGFYETMAKAKGEPSGWEDS